MCVYTYKYIWQIQQDKNLGQNKLQREIDESFARTYSPPSAEWRDQQRGVGSGGCRPSLGQVFLRVFEILLVQTCYPSV